MVETLFSSEFAQVALVFVLVFVLVFAILQKAKIFGEGKKQIDALVGLAVGLIVISVGYATELIRNLVPFLAVALVIIMVFMILLGAFFPEGKFDIPGWLKVVFGIFVFISVVIAVLYFTGAWDRISELIIGEQGSSIIFNVIFLVIIAAVVIAVILSSGKPKGSKE